MQIDLTAVKKEEAREKSSPTRSHTAKGKGKGKEPVRKIAGEEASDPPEDEPTDDDEHIFVTSGLLTATKCLSYTDLPCS